MKHCLIVDDSRVVRTMARRIVEDLGFAVGEAENGSTALDACNENMPDVILLDWNMPVLNGYEFLQELRRTDGGFDPVVIFLTTENGVEHIKKALEGGANEYIMKPFDAEIIESKLVQAGVL